MGDMARDDRSSQEDVRRRRRRSESLERLEIHSGKAGQRGREEEALMMLRLGDQVRASETFLERYGEWRDVPLWVIGLRLLPNGRGVDVEVSEKWPHERSSGSCDGFIVSGPESDDLTFHSRESNEWRGFDSCRPQEHSSFLIKLCPDEYPNSVHVAYFVDGVIRLYGQVEPINIQPTFRWTKIPS